MEIKSDWKRCGTKVFWNDVAHKEHVVQIYDTDGMLLNTLSDFAADGFNAGDSVIVIATADHLAKLNILLSARQFDLKYLIAKDQYIPLDADQMLLKFMINGSPDEISFIKAVTTIMKKARKNDRQVRAFGEMVSLLWQSGNNNATIRLEELWNNFCSSENFGLFCAYPKSCFSTDSGAAVLHICSAHSKLIASDQESLSEIQYKIVG